MQYALYKGDEFLTLGTIREIAEETGKSELTLRFYTTPAHRKRRKETSLIVIKIEED